MLTAIASAISESLCGVLNTHLTFGLAGSTIRPDAAIAIIGVSASATMSTIASEFGVTVEPTITSTLSSLRSLRVLVTALVVSEPSSSTIQFTFWPAIAVGSSSKVLRSGMPSEAAAPVADSVTPTLMSARAVSVRPSASTASANKSLVRVIVPPVIGFDHAARQCGRSFFQCIANLAQQLHVLRRRRRQRGAAHPIDLFHHKENDKGEDDEIERDGDEVAVGEERHPGLGQRFVGHRAAVTGRRRAQHDEPVAEVEPAENAADDGHDQVLDQRIDDLAERGADDHTHRQVDDATL